MPNRAGWQPPCAIEWHLCPATFFTEPAWRRRNFAMPSALTFFPANALSRSVSSPVHSRVIFRSPSARARPASPASPLLLNDKLGVLPPFQPELDQAPDGLALDSVHRQITGTRLFASRTNSDSSSLATASGGKLPTWVAIAPRGDRICSVKLPSCVTPSIMMVTGFTGASLLMKTSAQPLPKGLALLAEHARDLLGRRNPNQCCQVQLRNGLSRLRPGAVVLSKANA